ncbi:hypothetical protein HK099_000868, partial [Clydaea vesicula]
YSEISASIRDEVHDNNTTINETECEPYEVTKRSDILDMKVACDTSLDDLRSIDVTSVEHEGAPIDKDTVRMETKIAGQILENITENSCRIIQIADGDLKGWIPSSVISYIATMAVPNSFVKLNEIVKELEIQKVSVIINRGEEELTVKSDSDSESVLVESSAGKKKADSVNTTVENRKSTVVNSVSKINPVIKRDERIGMLAYISRFLRNSSPFMVFLLVVLNFYDRFKAKRN